MEQGIPCFMFHVKQDHNEDHRQLEGLLGLC